MKKIVKIFIVFILIINIFVIYIYFDGKMKMFYSPYHNYPIILKDMDNKEDFIESYFSKLRKYELIDEAYKLDSKIIDTSLTSILLNNDYINLQKISDYISISNVNFYDDDKLYEGQTTVYKTFVFDEIYKISVNIYKNSPSVYYHELLHTIFPWDNHEYDFFSEALVSIMVDESYKTDNNLYYNEKIITKMWIEILGVDVFKEMIAFGSSEPFIDKLLDLNIAPDKVDSILNNMDYAHSETLNKYEVYNKYIDLCIDDLDYVYKQIYNEEINSNKILNAYLIKIYDGENKNEKVYLDSSNYKYFIPYNNTNYYYYDNGEDIIKVNLDK